ncbi:MAG: single-stranded-DNA-specific exonuclease RecJ [Candidatus Shapirobacteria bacterium]|nr:single-stranded-DNA-specific exonuclease RecJ [Candidatus Shapirobacteria bacterium]
MKNWQVKFVPRGKNKIRRQKEIVDFLLSDRDIKNKKTFFKPPHPADINPAQVGIDPEQIIKAHQLIVSVKKTGKKILVWGDYDADGIVGTTLLWEALWKSGFDALPFIPNRADGYGLNSQSFKKLYHNYPDIGLVITVDNGIVAHQEVSSIASLGLKIIITDHHAKEKKTPQANAVIWSEQVCGAAVAWFLARKIIGQKDYGLDLLALATVADMMPLLGVNRSLVKYGLKYLINTSRPGLVALIKQASIKKEEIGVYHLGFLLGPRLNAMGRLYNALDSVRLLCTTDQGRASVLASKLDSANRERQLMTSQALEILNDIVKKEKLAEEKLIFVSHPSLASGIIGLVAGKLTDQSYRPSVVLACENGFFKASCRSIKGFDIIKALQKLDCLINVGGHPLAAGFTIKKGDFDQVKKSLLKLADKAIDEEMLKPVLPIDAQVSFADLDHSFWRQLNRLTPFGLGNPEPLFYTPGVIIKDLRKVGRNGDHLKLVLDEAKTRKVEKAPAVINIDDQLLPGIGFGLGKESLAIGDKIDIAFNLILNCYRGQKNLELKVKEIKKNAG